MQFKLITASGTFDRLHQGHKFFLKKAFEISDQVLIGITSDQFVKDKTLGLDIEAYETRKNAMISFLNKEGLSKRATIFKLDDVYGSAINSDSAIEAILVTEKTLSGAQAINKKRQSKNLPSLEIVKVDLVQEKGFALSSANLRMATIFKKTLFLPQNLRPILQKPLGDLIRGTEDDLTVAVTLAKKLIDSNPPTLIITVGDVVTKSFNQARILINLAIVDFKIKREETIHRLADLGFEKEEPDLVVNNPSGTISSKLSSGIDKLIKSINHKTLILRVLGEEDLAVLPAIVFSPPNTAIFYGQPPYQTMRDKPGEGIVYIKVNEEVRNRILDLLCQFE